MRRGNVLTGTLLVLMAFGVLAVSAGAQDDSSQARKHAGEWAMQFQVDRDLDLNSFDGATFAVTKHTHGKAFTRFAIGASGQVDGFDGRNDNYDGQWSEGESDNSYISLRVGLQRLWYIGKIRQTALFVGLGPEASFAYDESSSESRNSSYPPPNYRESSSTRWSAGLISSIGVEWFVGQTVSLTAEYGFDVEYSYVSQKTQRINRDMNDQIRTSHSKDSRDSIDFQGRGARLGLALYF